MIKNTIMKISMSKLLLVSTSVVLIAFQSSTPCDPKILKDNAKQHLIPYTYDLCKLTKITYKKTPQFKEIEVKLFLGEKYRLIFNTEALPIPVVISLYNKGKEHEKRKLLFTTKDTPANQKIFTFEYSWARKIYIDYEIPAVDSTQPEKTGCVYFLLGYK